MKRGGDRQHHRPLDAACFGNIHRAFHRGLGARQHHLATAIVIGGCADTRARCFRGNRFCLRQIEADEGRHGAGTDRNGFLHGLAADAQ